MPSCASFLEPRKSRLRPLKFALMLNISYAAFLCLSQLVLAQFALEICLAVRNRQKIHKTPYFSVQGHPRSLMSLAVESQCTTDRRTDGQIVLRCLRRAESSRKNLTGMRDPGL